MPAAIIKRFMNSHGVRGFALRRRDDGAFQIIREGYNLDCAGPDYWISEDPVTGIYGDRESAEKEALRLGLQPEPEE